MLTKLFRRSKPVRKTTKLNLVSLEARDVPANFAVINTNDAGIGSLRQAIVNANGSDGADTIVFAAGTFSTPKTITLATPIDITQGLTIEGPSRDLLTISGNNASRIFNVAPPVNGNIVYLNDITLSKAKATAVGQGAAISINTHGTVYLYDSYVQNNAGDFSGAVRVSGGSFYSYGTTFRDNTANNGAAVFAGNLASVSFNLCTFERNTTVHQGGAIFMSTSYLGATDCTFADNKAGFDGGAVNFDAGGDWIINTSTFRNNSASSGGALNFENGNNPYSNRLINNSTFTSNTAEFYGGAIDFLDMSAGTSAEIENCTIAGNTAGSSGGGVNFNNVENVNGSVKIGSSIVASNVAPVGANLHSFNTSSKFATSYSALGPIGGNHSGVANLPGFDWTADNLKLGTLADNGGNTFTMALADDSPARNKGFNYGDEFSEDQRGELRATNGAADIGAFETRQQFIVTNNKDSGAGSLRQAVLDANAFESSGDLITFDPVYFSLARQITLTSGSITSMNNLEIDGPGAKNVIISGNNASNGLYFSGGTGTSILRDVTVANNSEFAVHASVADFVLDNCIVRDNHSPVLLSAVFINGGTVTVSNSSITGNSNGGHGGGIEFFSTTSATLRNTTVSNNIADSGGGVRANVAVQIINSTISSNSAATNGGGISFTQFAASPLIVNSTITNNTAGTQGGGIHVPGLPAQSLEFVSSVVSGNIAPSAKDVFTFHVTTPVNARSSAVGSLAGIAQFNDLGGNIAPGTDLKLNALANTGGLGSTHAPRPGSPLLNVGSNPFNLATDQRGLPREEASGVDIGSVEARIAPQFVVRVDNDSGQRSRVRSLTVEFDRVVTLGNAFELLRTGPAGTAAPTGTVIFNIDSIINTPMQTIARLVWNDPVFTEHGSLIDGTYRLAIVASQVTDANGYMLDGNGDGIGGDTATTNLYRFFGDSDGNATVDASDFADFGGAFGGSGDNIFDFNADGLVDAGDLAEFGNRFGITLI